MRISLTQIINYITQLHSASQINQGIQFFFLSVIHIRKFKSINHYFEMSIINFDRENLFKLLYPLLKYRMAKRLSYLENSNDFGYNFIII